MNFTKTSVALAAATLAALGAAAAHAQQDTGWYGGGNVGRSRVNIDDERIRAGLLGQGLGTDSIDDRRSSTGFKAFGGYQFNPYLGAEAGYFSLGRFGYTAHTTPAGTLDGNIRLNGWNLDLVGTLPLAANFSALGRVGVTSMRARDSFSATGAARVPYASTDPSERSTNLKVGVGLAYDFTPALGMRLELERYRLKDAVGNKGHADMVSVGLVYR